MKKKILITVNSYLPGFESGGPVQSIAPLADLLSEEYEVTVLTNDRDSNSKFRYPNITVNVPIRIGDYDVIYLDKSSLFKFYFILKCIKNVRPDVIYMNSFFNPFYSLLIVFVNRFRILGDVKIILAPRGEFSPGALALKKKKKNFTIFFLSHFHFLKQLHFHFTNVLEKQYFFDHVSSSLVGGFFISGNLKKLEQSDFSDIETLLPFKERNKIRICFLSRIVPKKNIVFVLNVLNKLDDPGCEISLEIYGPLEDLRYWRHCEKIISKFPPNIIVKYCGSVPNTEISKVFLSNDLFFFPTKGENFGHVIVESLVYACPVLISDQTPWLDIESSNAGWIHSLDDQTVPYERLKDILSMDNHSYLKFRLAAHQYGNNYLKKNVSINFLNFRSALSSIVAS